MKLRQGVALQLHYCNTASDKGYSLHEFPRDEEMGESCQSKLQLTQCCALNILYKTL